MFAEDSSPLSQAEILIQILGVLNVCHPLWTVCHVPALLEGFVHTGEGGKWFLDYPLERQSIYLTPLIKIMWLEHYTIRFNSSL